MQVQLPSPSPLQLANLQQCNARLMVMEEEEVVVMVCCHCNYLSKESVSVRSTVVIR